MLPLFSWFSLFAASDMMPGNAVPIPIRRDHFSPTDNSTFGLWILRIGDGLFKRQIFYLPGLTPLHSLSSVDLFPVPASVAALAARLDATILIPEHRCVGLSLPGFDPWLCRVDQVLADIAAAIQVVIDYPPWKADYALVVGEGYAGTLAAFFRAKYSHYIDGAWASAAPVVLEAFTGEADGKILRALDRVLPGCNATAQRALEYADNLTTENLSAVFGFHGFQPSFPYLRERMLHAVAEIFPLIVRQGTAKDFCDNHSVNSSELLRRLAGVYDQSLSKLGLTADSMDLLFVNNSVSLFTKCSFLGQFAVRNESSPFRSASLNETFYRDLCRYIGVDPLASIPAYNEYFGGQEQGSSRVLFTYSPNDIHSASMAVVEDISRDRLVVASETGLDGIDNVSHAILEEWVIGDPCWEKRMVSGEDTRHPTRGHGESFMGHCKCKPGWGGLHCEVEHITLSKFKGLATTAIAIPTLLVFLTSIVAWKTILVDPDTARSKPIVL